ncbi:MAG TPA: DUF3108 domain-containing protein [Candidatus Eisenbacteria bacterium]|jgi:hypothetical protein|nr:DUF3108 domain-containing protein [Candidatus Eisenbacteria bacterium]
MKRRFSWFGIAIAAGMVLAVPSLPGRLGAPRALADEPPPAANAAPPSAVAAESLAAPDSADAGIQTGLAPVPWKIGEYFQFSIDWNGLNGGGSLMQVQNIVRVDGRRAYRIVTKAESNSFVSKFYKVRDRAESFVDAESLYSVRFVKHLREGGYKKDVDIRFDQAAGKARYDDGKTFDVPKRVHDVLSAFYYVRTVPLPDGATLSIPTHDNDKTYEMVVKVHGREKVEVPAGKFDCVVVEPILKSEGVFKSKGSILVYLSDDARRIPVMVKSKIPVGAVTVSLTDMRLAFPGRH